MRANNRDKVTKDIEELDNAVCYVVFKNYKKKKRKKLKLQKPKNLKMLQHNAKKLLIN